MKLRYSEFPIPFGTFSVAVDDAGAVAAAAFGGVAALRRRLRQPTFGEPVALVADEHPVSGVREQVTAYFGGTLRAFDISLAPKGTEFQKRVWKALSRIRFGETQTYAELAIRTGSSPRAVGRANAANPVALIVPCHRVIGADGSLTGFAFGTRVKLRLLEHEAEWRRRAP